MLRNSTVEPEAVAGPTDAAPDAFELDVRLLEIADPAGLVNVTDDGCTSTCGACISNAY
ncbi:FxLD family lanthipeptide [Actinomadura sp. WMMB 499]|uniref:FxLD family lanthipeptide n=1 Tax=Actinomadura sp. WMMB 499 TaxID=1219491 RepID=UPI0012473411|nr:FxLD family lanthipeptide [Actinomadura sp. WMMB 499]QFG22880.1 FxLD family lantipeptide [Actinomadura sp. WMMB 499]